MIHPIHRVAALVTAALFCATFLVVSAQDAPKEKKKGGGALPYAGKISAVDSGAKTVTLSTKNKSKTFVISDATKITKDGKPAGMEVVVVGEEGAVSYVTKDGKDHANSLRVGAKPPEGDAPKKKKKTEAN